MALGWLVWAALFAVTIVGLPFARQCLKLARFTLWPFGRTAVRSADASALGLVGNVLWFIPGVLLAIGYAVSGALMCLTVIGIPFGMQAFKFVPLAISPFGKEIVKAAGARARPPTGGPNEPRSATTPASARVLRQPEPVWLPAGEIVQVDGRSIAGGMVYVGSGVPSLSGYDVEPCLIDPSLSVHWESP